MRKNNIDLPEQRQNIVKSYLNHLKKQIFALNAEYWRFITRTNRRPTALQEKAEIWDVYLKWQEYQLEKHDKEDFVGIEDDRIFNMSRTHTHQQVPITASEPDVFKNYTGLENSEIVLETMFGKQSVMVSPWPMRFSNKVISKLKNQKEIYPILEAIFSLQLGYINDAQILDTGPIMYLAGFSKMIKGQQTIVFAVVPERVPVVQMLNNKQVVIGFKFRQYLRIIDIVGTQDKKLQYQAYQNFQYYIQSDPDKWNPFMPGSYLENPSLQVNQNKELLDISNIVSFRETLHGLLYLPLLNSEYKLSLSESRNFQLVSYRWVSELEDSKFSFRVSPDLKNQNRDIIAKCTSEESCQWLLQFLEKIPNFNLRLTTQEKKLITTAGNILCIGRSGTGKTTSAVLRLFALEILFKIRSSFFMKKDSSLKASNFTAEDAESFTGLHSVIVTASPVLTNEIRRFYNNLKNQIISELKKRDEKKKLKQRQEENKSGDAIQNEDSKQEQFDALEFQITQEEKKEDDNNDINEDEILDAEEMEKNLKLPQSMNEMRNDDFPAFLTIKRLVFMIDASLTRPFFARNLKNEIIGLDSQAEWHNEQKGVLMINNYYKMGQELTKQQKSEEQQIELDSSQSSEDEDEDEVGQMFQQVQNQVQKSKKKRTKVIQGEKVIQEYAQEVDYDLFERKFWPKFCYRERHLTPASLWTEIYSVIKGAHNSSEYLNLGLPLDKYIQQSSKRVQLSNLEKEQIYQYYQKYEAWKRDIKGFDFMDLVNHILRTMQGYGYRGTPLHFLLVDEVQDLTAATIKLLLKVTEQNAYFAGDTAQTIARGVGFRFCDLKQMLNMNDFEAPKVLQLTVNFRSHNKILTLANSIISAIELFFPLTIDKLIKEKSNIDGLKPIVLDSNMLDSLFYVLLGNQEKKKEKLLEKGQTEFGCDQVIIVRDQASKKKVPSVLQHALILTVYECKGLEFDDVILYNFFNDAPQTIQEQWKLLNYIQVDSIKEKKKSEVNEMQDLDDLNFEVIKEEEGQQTNQEEELVEGEYDYANRFYLTYKKDNVYKEYSALCTDLKQLYVCITRPKKRLIIYDEDPQSREIMMKYWQKLNAVDVITEEVIKQSKQSEQNLTEEQRKLIEKLREGQEEQVKDEDPYIKEQKKKGWRQQGIKMFKRRYYEQAIKCFEHSGDENLKKRSNAYHLAEEASKTQSEYESLQYRLDDQSLQLVKQEKRKMKEEIQSLKEKSIALFKQASDVFVEINLIKQAAQCLYTAEQYVQSAKLFEQIGFYSQAGEAFYILGDYTRAAMLYNEGKMVIKAVECYKKMQNWDAILNCIKNNENEFTQEQREVLIQKYVPLALNNLYTLMTNDDLIEEDALQEDNEIKKPQKDYEINTTIKNDIIHEKDSESEEDNEEEKQVHDQQTEEIQLIESENEDKEESEILTQKSELQQEESMIEIINTTSQKKKQSPVKSEISASQEFSIISSVEAQSVNNNNINKDSMTESFEHLSQFDPEDEFIKSRTVSVLESVISGEYRSRDNKSELSDYSIIDLSEKDYQMNNDILKDIIQSNVNIIRTKRDIYAEDILMTKIIHYVSQFSQDVQSYLGKLRSKDALLSQSKPKNQEFEQINTNTNPFYEEYDFDLDQVDQEFLNILLDCLESFELYKLCLIVCNRYQLTERVGRYLISIANKYSNLKDISTKFVTMFNHNHKDVQYQVSFIAHQAIHSAFELIEPKYLKIKDGNLDSENSLGQYCYTGLFNLGFWKKLLYLMDLKSSLTVASMFADFANFKQIYLGFYQKSKNKDKIQIIDQIKEIGFSFLEDKIIPEDEIQSIAFMAALDQVVWNILKDMTINVQKIQFPKVFELTEKALRIVRHGSYCIQNKDEEITFLIQELQERIYKITQSKPISINKNQYEEQCLVYDTSVATILLVESAFKTSQTSQVHLLNQLSSQLFQKYLRTLNCLFNLTMNQQDKTYNANIQTLINGMLSVLRVRSIPQCDGIYDNYGDKVLIHFESGLAQYLTKELEERKKKIADNIQQETFQEFNINFHTRQEINQIIKKRLREAYNNESLNNLIEIVDLEANFMRAPLQIVLDKVKQHLYNYIKNCSIKMFASQNLCLQKKYNIDDLESPFEIIERYNKIVGLLNSGVEVFRFVFSKDPSIKQLTGYLGKKKEIYDVNSLQYHQKLEEKQKQEKEIEFKKYMLQIGLINDKEYENFLKKKNKEKEKQNILNINQAHYNENITIFAFQYFNPLPNLDSQTIQNILEIAQSQWESFIQFKNNSGDGYEGLLKYALSSLSLYIATNNYIYFMNQLQKQLSPNSKERKLLFNLIDAHIFKKYGQNLQASQSLIKFLKLLLEDQIYLQSYYCITILEMAFILLLSTNHEKLIIPFELTRHLSCFFAESQEGKTEFLQQLKIYNNGETQDPLKLKLKNSKYQKIDTQQEKQLYQQLVKEIIELTQIIFGMDQQIYGYTHLFYLAITLALNEPIISDQYKDTINKFFDILIEDGMINDDNFIFGQTSYYDLRKEFDSMDYESQNSQLYTNKGESQQSIFVKVEIETTIDLKQLRENIELDLSQSEDYEAVQLSLYQRTADMIQPIWNKFKESKTIKKLKQQKQFIKVEDHLLLKHIGFQQKHLTQDKLGLLEIYRKSSNLSKFIRGVILHSTFENVIDLHYLLTQIHKIETEINPQIKDLINKKLVLQSDLDSKSNEIKEKLDVINHQVGIWSQNKYVPSTKFIEKNQRIMKLKWKEHAQKLKQKIMAKVTARKKEDAAEKKKLRIKNRRIV